ncbi:o-succinylbenzoate synthase [Siphonobacter sp.]|uniref:o-succinylbenzoate synthase n=1 Tax=Siphonobacter sp. TaxID=1869184 RepID=UPI003B3AFFE8
MSLKVLVHKHILDFRFAAGTSRGTLTQHTAYYLKVFDDENPYCFGLGEASPLAGLSPDYVNFEATLQKVCQAFNRYDLEVFSWNLDLILNQLVDPRFPTIRMGLETALRDLLHEGKRQIFKNSFSEGEREIPINGLIWMGDKNWMLQQIDQKLEAGFRTLKMKVGAIDFEQEMECLTSIRKRFSPEAITLRVDANGAWTPEEAQEKLNRLAELSIHSIEQPIKARQPEAMAALCEQSPIPIALDEELIGVYDYMDKMRLLKKIQPPFIILKPTLLGGFTACKEWIEIANRLKIKWWLTSALESNIGLNAIAQFAGEFQNPLPQGLGTGGLYYNNVPSPLSIAQGQLSYNSQQPWDLQLLQQSFITHPN